MFVANYSEIWCVNIDGQFSLCTWFLVPKFHLTQDTSACFFFAGGSVTRLSFVFTNPPDDREKEVRRGL